MEQNLQSKAMRIITDITEANNLFQSYNGATLQIAFYSENLKRIAIRIWIPDNEKIIYFVGIGCKSMNGHFKEKNTILSITMTFDKVYETIVTLNDKNSDFKLSTYGGFSLAHGLESEFGPSFDGFINEISPN